MNDKDKIVKGTIPRTSGLRPGVKNGLIIVASLVLLATIGMASYGSLNRVDPAAASTSTPAVAPTILDVVQPTPEPPPPTPRPTKAPTAEPARVADQPAPPPPQPAAPPPQEPAPPAPVATPNRAELDAKADFGVIVPPSNAEPSPSSAPSDWVQLPKGFLIPVVVKSSIDGTLGRSLITANISRDVRWPLCDKCVVLPMGATVVGEVGDASGLDSSRLPIIWEEIQIPDSPPIELADAIGADRTGTSGIGAKVDYHTQRLLMTALGTSAVGALAGAVGSGSSSCNGCGQSVGSSMAAGAGSAVLQATSAILSRAARVKDTPRVSAGQPLTIEVLRPFSLPHRGGA